MAMRKFIEEVGRVWRSCRGLGRPAQENTRSLITERVMEFD